MVENDKQTNRNPLFFGILCFFSDLSTKMVYPLIPLYLTLVFGVPPTFIGIIEGIVDSTSSILKFVSGRLSDRFQKTKGLAFFGYSTAVVYKFLLVIASSWGFVLFAKIIDRIGKGIRATPKYVLIADGSDKKELGKSFGLQKMLDRTGSAIGILIAYFLMVGGVRDYKTIFLIAAIPAAIGLCMFFFIKDRGTGSGKKGKGKNQLPFFASFKILDNQLKLYLLVVVLFTLGFSSNAFLLLRANSIGFSETSIILLYFALTTSSAVFMYPFGKLSDKIGRKFFLVSGYFVFSIVYVGFALAFNHMFLIGMFLLFGVHCAMITGTERAFLSEIAPPELRGTVIGLQATVAGLALLPANIIAGVLWDTFSAFATFIFGACMSFLAAMILLLFFKNKKATEQNQE